MYPPPPRLPASGYVTASANPTATAASTALPPRRRVSTPARLASESLLETIARRAYAAARPESNRHSAGKRSVDVDGGLQVATVTIKRARASRRPAVKIGRA